MTRQELRSAIRAAIAAAACITIVACGRTERQPDSGLTDADREGIRRLDSAFVSAWLRDDTAAVLRTFSSDAVLLPPNANPVAGLKAIKAYWWPEDGSHTKITSFERQIVEIAGSRELAFVRGTAKLGWIYEKDNKKSSQTSRSTDLLIVAPDSAGKWHVIRQMWSTLP